MKSTPTKSGSLDAFNALSVLVNATSEAFSTHQVEKTKRDQLRTYRETEIAQIKSSEKMLRDYFDRIFAERRQIHTKLFDTLDHALETGDAAVVQSVVGGIVDVATSSPLADLGNLGELRRAMNDPNAIFEL